MMKRQLELRRDETSVLHRKCDALEAKLAELRASVDELKQGASKSSDEVDSLLVCPVANRTDSFNKMEVEISAPTPEQSVTAEDVHRWAEEVA